MSYFKRKIILIVALFLLLIGALFIYKYHIINDESENVINNVSVFKYKGTFFKYGNIGKYPILKKSVDSITWKTINVRGFFYDLIPTGSSYANMQAVENTIWFFDRESCAECDCLQRLHNIYYSHNNGVTWNVINPGSPCTHLSFKNDQDGVMVYDEEKQLITKNGGKTWEQK